MELANTVPVASTTRVESLAGLRPVLRVLKHDGVFGQGGLLRFSQCHRNTLECRRENEVAKGLWLDGLTTEDPFPR
jgi:hypothetical protein